MSSFDELKYVSRHGECQIMHQNVALEVLDVA